MREGNKELNILLSTDLMEQGSLDALGTMPIFSAKGRAYSMEQAAASFSFEFGLPMIRRIDSHRVMKAQCDPKNGANTIALFEELNTQITNNIDLPDGYRMEIYGEQESREESNKALAARLPLTLILIVVLLVLLFGNYRDSLIILLMTPMIFVGVVAGLLFTGNSFDFFSLLGVIGLVGMNIKNAVILVSSINQLREMGADPYEAVVEAARSRLLPVCMASGTTILALIPLLFDSLFAGMASTIMGGLLVATLLTMVLLPVVYAIFYNIKPQ
jgi:multidrug efflux pump subunit AcrB